MRLKFRTFGLVAGFALVLATRPAGADYLVTKLVSDVPGLAANTDPNLKNPWGVSASGSGPFWVANQGSNSSTLYNGSGGSIPLVVTIPTTTGGPNGPTGLVFNGTTDFALSNGRAATFLFANLNGQISGWNSGLGTSGSVTALNAVTNTGAIYTGLAMGQANAVNFLYAADAKGNKVDVYDSRFGNLDNSLFSGKFADPALTAAGFRVYNVQNIGGNQIAVTYDSLANNGNPAISGGAVAIFDAAGNLVRDFSNGPGGPLQDPWGVVIAPAGFGRFGGDLLVGDQESGRINAFDPASGAFLGLVATITNDPTSTNNGLWALAFGNGRTSGDANTLYAFAGINNEVDGLMASVTSVPEPGSILLLGIGGTLAGLAARRRRARP